ncbi:hypothetical protein NIES2135_67630 (plasmid) [Leptolyngbya boryana NIES-2135]|jgi:hypothetical protein|uniref:Uncharacterized protein n=1 Tax=Leptolyngbya boryana NIES-2135 TaxID=1973484 RepID=A0A1Z4JT71_LEPBY|nr:MULTISPECIES: hypothetical protein [Leptolyngbya]BAY59886.1 hypothetical protein NIES2135_67630 [Leptolyngbya boryana NIES-2135]MBD2369562.1 hypothetical protein [Leptolyngbya sp. FACHB-161]MBD2375993.1 hypothetical protein [Leptolyngbya sp. FACHB-238]MBD2400269.1 hypothetical protein [Leptolyngbya sp. FACHB-239]MBD2406811.1 hypothetical protein [Leptolyngbya sp. FACHB-402]
MSPFMLNRLIALFLIIAFLLTVSIAGKPVLASSLNSMPLDITGDPDYSGQNLLFSDSDEFYKKLSSALKDGKSFNVATSYDNYFDFPLRLQEVFRADPSSVAKIAEHSIPATLNPKPLETFAYSALGCGLGAAIGAATCGGVELLTNGKTDFSKCEKRTVALFTLGGCATGFVSTVGSYNYRVELGKLTSDGFIGVTLTPEMTTRF